MRSRGRASSSSQPGPRVVDAVAAAGGFTAEADPAGVNLARPVVDGEQLAVLAVGQAPPQPRVPAAGGATGPAADGIVNLNTADLAALDTLPRIGPALAQRIIDWREANGPFTSVDQLLEVAGIGDAVSRGLADGRALSARPPAARARRHRVGAAWCVVAARRCRDRPDAVVAWAIWVAGGALVGALVVIAAGGTAVDAGGRADRDRVAVGLVVAAAAAGLVVVVGRRRPP